MKQVFFLLLSLGIISVTYTATAQEDVLKENKNEEIIIRKKGDKNVKVTVELKDEDILINGKPLSEFNDDNVTVMKRKDIIRHGNNMFIRPHGGNSFFYDDDHEKVTRPFLGVTSEKTANGVRITDVIEGSAAEKAGLKEGDVITKIGSKKIEDPENLMDVVKSYKPKDEAKVYYERSGKSNEAKIVFGEKKQDRFRSFSFNGDRMNADILKDLRLDMPDMPKQPFYNFWIPSNKKIGVKIEDTDNDSGAKITNVEEGSAAEKAGLKKDDIITEVDGNKVKSVNEVRDKILENEKSSYTIKAKRGAGEMSFEIKVPKKINSANL